MKVALVGGTGFVGSYLVEALLQRGHLPCLLVREGSEEKVVQADRCEMPDSAKRYEFSTMAYGMALGAAVALDYLNELTSQRIADHNRLISDQLTEGFQKLGASIISPSDRTERSATVAARFPGHESAEVAAALKSQEVAASLRLDFLRFSPHFYNGSSDIEKALDVIGKIVR